MRIRNRSGKGVDVLAVAGQPLLRDREDLHGPVALDDDRAVDIVVVLVRRDVDGAALLGDGFFRLGLFCGRRIAHSGCLRGAGLAKEQNEHEDQQHTDCGADGGDDLVLRKGLDGGKVSAVMGFRRRSFDLFHVGKMPSFWRFTLDGFAGPGLEDVREDGDLGG